MPTATKPAAKKTPAKKRSAKAKAPRGKVGATKAPTSKTFSPSEIAKLEQWAAHEAARAKGETVETDLDLMREVKKLKPGYSFHADDEKALADSKPARKASSSRSTAKAKGSKRGRGFLDCAIEVLEKADGPMTTKEITDKVLGDKMTTTTGGKTPAAAMYVQLHQAAFKRVPKVIVRTAPSTWDVAKLNPKGAKKRPAGKS